jgi:hypothetical protein
MRRPSCQEHDLRRMPASVWDARIMPYGSEVHKPLSCSRLVNPNAHFLRVAAANLSRMHYIRTLLHQVNQAYQNCAERFGFSQSLVHFPRGLLFLGLCPHLEGGRHAAILAALA